MNYVILKNYDHYAIVNDDADFIVGRVYPLDGQEGFRVSADLPSDCECDDVAVVPTLDDAIPALAAYYERNQPSGSVKPRRGMRSLLSSLCYGLSKMTGPLAGQTR